MVLARRIVFVFMVLAGIGCAAIFLSPLMGELGFWGRFAADFALSEAGSIGIIGGADGPTAIFTATKFAPHVGLYLLVFMALYVTWAVLRVKTGK